MAFQSIDSTSGRSAVGVGATVSVSVCASAGRKGRAGVGVAVVWTGSRGPSPGHAGGRVSRSVPSGAVRVIEPSGSIRSVQCRHVGHDDATVGAPGVGRLLVVRDEEPADLHHGVSPTLQRAALLTVTVGPGGRSQGVLDGGSNVLVERSGDLEAVVDDPRRRHRPLWNVLDRLGAGLCVFAVVDGVGALEPVGQLGDGGLGRQTGEELDMSTAVFGEPCHVVGGDLGREHVDLGAGEALIAPGIEDLGPPTQLLRPGGGPPRLARGGPAPTAGTTRRWHAPRPRDHKPERTRPPRWRLWPGADRSTGGPRRSPRRSRRPHSRRPRLRVPPPLGTCAGPHRTHVRDTTRKPRKDMDSWCHRAMRQEVVP
jgi:hypothetical protein